MTITIDGVTYRNDDSYTLRQALAADQLHLRLNGITDPTTEVEWMRDAAAFIADELFGGQFTTDHFVDLYRSPTVFKDLHAMLAGPRGMIEGKLAAFPSTGDAAKNAEAGRKKR